MAGANALTDIAEKRASPKEALKTRAKEIVFPQKDINKSDSKKKIIRLQAQLEVARKHMH